MIKLLGLLSGFLTENGYEHIFRDMMPSEKTQLEAINLSKWDSTVSSYGTGDGAHYIQIQVRRADYDEACAVCTEIFKLLDSGIDEKVFEWGGRGYICRPRRAPLLLERTESSVTIYCETVIFGAI